MDILFQGPCSGIPSGRWEAHEWERGIPQNIKKLATKAKDACERLLKDGSKLIAQADLQGLVKEGYKTLSTHIQNLNNFLMFDELPSDASVNKASLENFIGHIAQDVEKFNGEIQAAKARAKAKS